VRESYPDPVAWRKFLAQKGIDEKRFRSFVHGLKPAAVRRALEGKIAPEALTIILNTLDFLRSV
jgi:hypothetical protein